MPSEAETLADIPGAIASEFGIKNSITLTLRLIEVRLRGALGVEDPDLPAARRIAADLARASTSSWSVIYPASSAAHYDSAHEAARYIEAGAHDRSETVICALAGFKAGMREAAALAVDGIGA